MKIYIIIRVLAIEPKNTLKSYTHTHKKTRSGKEKVKLRNM